MVVYRGIVQNGFKLGIGILVNHLELSNVKPRPGVCAADSDPWSHGAAPRCCGRGPQGFRSRIFLAWDSYVKIQLFQLARSLALNYAGTKFYLQIRELATCCPKQRISVLLAIPWLGKYMRAVR